jgi:hypothetical protein
MKKIILITLLLAILLTSCTARLANNCIVLDGTPEADGFYKAYYCLTDKGISITLITDRVQRP